MKCNSVTVHRYVRHLDLKKQLKLERTADTMDELENVASHANYEQICVVKCYLLYEISDVIHMYIVY
jgi:hypothetical protein